jgi:glycosyltransferase involved in cell wall biosynthesis
MFTNSQSIAYPTDQREATETAAATEAVHSSVALLTGGFDRPYVFGLAMEMIAKGVSLDVIGSDEIDSPEMRTTPGLNFLNLQGSKQEASLAAKVSRVLTYYFRLIRYTATAKPKIFHIVWNNKFIYFDRIFLMLYYKLLAKRIVFTVHNVNAGKRDGHDSMLNRLTLKAQYRLVDHIFVHTKKMKEELLKEFGVRDSAVTVIPFGINNSVPHTDLSPLEARRRLGIPEGEETILFFGAIRQYKGLEYLVDAFQRIAAKSRNYRLIIAGEPKRGSEQYLAEIQEAIARGPGRDRVTQSIKFVPDAETELYFKAADVCVLPYTVVFQSGVLFLSYSFGLPVIATEVGSFEDDIVEGRNGFVCRACDAEHLAKTIEKYFDSDLFKNLDRRRGAIRKYANSRNSWNTVGTLTRDVYARLVGS